MAQIPRRARVCASAMPNSPAVWLLLHERRFLACCCCRPHCSGRLRRREQRCRARLRQIAGRSATIGRSPRNDANPAGVEARSHASPKRLGSRAWRRGCGRWYPCENAKIERPKGELHENAERGRGDGVVDGAGLRADPQCQPDPRAAVQVAGGKGGRMRSRTRPTRIPCGRFPTPRRSSDPWGTVRSTEAPKAAPAKQKTKTGSSNQ